MPGQIHHLPCELTNLKRLALCKQMVKLRTIGGKAAFQVENAFEDFLHNADVCANRRASAELFFEVRRCRQMIGMRMRLKNPRNLQVIGMNKCNHFISRSR